MKARVRKLGEAMMMRGATFALRRAGARIAEDQRRRCRPPAPPRRRVMRASSRRRRAARRRSPISPTALESAAPATRARGIEQFGAWASAQARDGEVGACERLVAK